MDEPSQSTPQLSPLEQQPKGSPKGGRLARAFVAVGSNIDPEVHIPAALDALSALVRVEASSTFFRCEPVGRPEQPLFVNGVWRIRTDMAPTELKFAVLRKIESHMGRERTDDRYAPRIIDLDLILYEDKIIDETDLKIPDPDIKTRPFIAVPLLEIAPDLVIPGSSEHLCELDVVSRNVDLEALHELTLQLKRRIGQ